MEMYMKHYCEIFQETAGKAISEAFLIARSRWIRDHTKQDLFRRRQAAVATAVSEKNPPDLGKFPVKLPSGKHTKNYWSHGPVEIVDLPINSMVDLSIVLWVISRGKARVIPVISTKL